MNILALDTCISSCSVALISNNILIKTICENTPSRQAECLIPLIQQILHETNLDFAQLTALALTIGPGSFTGVRIGISATQGIKLVTKLPVIQLGTLEVLARNVNNSESLPIMATLNASRGEVYGQIFNADCSALSPPLLLDYEQALNLAPPEKFYLVGSARTFIQDRLPYKNFIAVTDLDIFSASEVALAAGQLTIDLNAWQQEIEPLYIRESDAKVPTMYTLSK
jgi:tRNA threonylcarbamoyladenosine biosynthesis protein TsaB